MIEHWFWTLMALAVFLWHIVVTVIVTVKGGKDIRDMIKGWGEE